MDFEERLKRYLYLLKARPDFKTDEVFQSIVEIISRAKTVEDLSVEYKLIARMAIDGVINFETQEIILNFMKPYEKKTEF